MCQVYYCHDLRVGLAVDSQKVHVQAVGGGGILRSSDADAIISQGKAWP